MLGGTLIGPYARQTTQDKLKFWFVLAGDVNWRPSYYRYEVTYDRVSRSFAFRARHRKDFGQYAIPADVSPFPRIDLGEGGLIKAAVALLPPADLARVAFVRMTGSLPPPPPQGG